MECAGMIFLHISEFLRRPLMVKRGIVHCVNNITNFIFNIGIIEC